MKKPSPRTQLLIGVIVSLVFLVLALRGIAFAELGSALADAEIAWSLPALLLILAAAFWVRAWRWSLILRPTEPATTREVFPAMMVGFMGNNLYPAHLGEFLRAYAFGKQRGLPFSLVFSTLVVERLFDLFAILGYFYTAIFFLDADAIPELIRKAALVAAAVTAAAALGLIPFVMWTEASLRLVRRLTGFLPASLADKIVGAAESGARGLAVARSPKLLIACLFASLLHWFLFGLLAVIAMRAFGVVLDLPQALFLQGVTALAVSIPASPGFFGVVQYAFKVTLELFKVEGSVAVAGSMYYHITQYIPVTLVGLYFLKILGVDMNAARAAQAESDGGAPTIEGPNEPATAASREAEPDSEAPTLALETES